MKALSVRQPWAWLILHGGKDVENRTWETFHRGPFLIHAASKGMTWAEYHAARDFAAERGVRIPPPEEYARGGIVGVATLHDCVHQCEAGSRSPWFVGPFGFMLRDARVVEFQPLRGQLGFFSVPMEL